MTRPDEKRDPPFEPGRAIVAALNEAREQLEELIELAGVEAREEWDEIEELAEAGIRQARRILIFLAGTTLVLTGVLLIFTPAPGSVVILGGLGVLAVEFAWARRWRIRLERAIAMALTQLRRRLEIEFGDDT